MDIRQFITAGKDGVNTWDYSGKRATESVYESLYQSVEDNFVMGNAYMGNAVLGSVGGSFVKGKGCAVEIGRAHV